MSIRVSVINWVLNGFELNMEVQNDDLNKLTNIGYKVNLCEDVNDTLLCPFCKLLMRNPVQTFRGELACEYCYLQAQITNQDTGRCPIDGEPIESNQVFQDKYKTREILQLRCFCCNKNCGCKWEGVLSLIKDHERGCKYKKVNCYMCKKKEMQLSDVNSHLKVCSALVLDGRCIYPGCDVYNIKSISDLQHHLATHLIVHNILNMSAISNIREQLITTRLELTEKKEREQRLETQVNDLQQQTTAINSIMLPIQTKYEQLISKHQDTVAAMVEAGLEKRLSSENGLSLSAYNSATHETKTNNRNDNIFTTVKLLNQNISDLNLRQQLYENTSYNGRLLWKIDDVVKRLDKAKNGKITALHSAPTFTEVYGYKFCGRLYLNGDGVGKCTHISLFFVLMKSEYDNLLMWPFRKAIRMRLLNQIDREKDVFESFESNVNSSSFTKPKNDMNIASGCPLFISKEKFINDGFIKDDTIFVDVCVSDITPTKTTVTT